MEKIKRISLLLLILVLLFSRLQGLDWGLPFPFHPDERNMANAVQQLGCEWGNWKDCFHPHFFAYGQFPLYLSYGLVYFFKFFDGDLNTPVGFAEATFALRMISALASLGLAYFVVKLVGLLNKNKNTYFVTITTLVIVTFSPALIQFAHFGTTESLLMLFYTWLTYASLRFISDKSKLRPFLISASLISGLAVATKASALNFLAIPVFALFYRHGKNVAQVFTPLFSYGVLTALVAIIFSPHNLLSFKELLFSLNFESAVALRGDKVFYTRQFENTTPVLFQFMKIFPYALGWPLLILFVVGFFVLPWNKLNNFLRLAFLIYFLPNAFFFAKWTRFMAPIMPLMISLAILMLFEILDRLKNNVRMATALFITILIIIPGFAYLSIYQHPDVRFTASAWVVDNVPSGSYVLSETANVVDIPVDNLYDYRHISFNFYDLDQDPALQTELQEHLKNAQYIFVPSRRLFANHSQEQYPQLNSYYDQLFGGELGFTKVAEFSSHPRISFLGKTLLEFPDEGAEETWTVFDHPVIRIYQKQ